MVDEEEPMSRMGEKTQHMCFQAELRADSRLEGGEDPVEFVREVVDQSVEGKIEEDWPEGASHCMLET